MIEETFNNNQVLMMTESLISKYPNSFVHLHLHTQYSLLDGAIRLNDLFDKAKSLNMPAVAQTDHGNMFGAIDFYTSAKKNGIKPILGCEVYFTPSSRHEKIAHNRNLITSGQDEVETSHRINHLVLLCKNKEGYHNLCKLVSRAYLEGFYYKPRLDLELLRKYNKGLIATTACLSGEVSQHYLMGQDKKAEEAIGRLHDIFSEDLYLEVQVNGMKDQEVVNEKIFNFAKKSGLPLVATNDCHYLNREDAIAQEVLLCVQTGKTLSDDRRMKLSTDEFYVKSPEEMREAFKDHIEACDNTLKIADMCNVELSWEDELGNQIYHLPDFKIETEETEEQYFWRLSSEGLQKRFEGPHFLKLVESLEWDENKKRYIARLEEELGMISKMGFAGYFLIVADFITWSRENGIPVGPGRGSGAGSLVAYAMGITNVDPLQYNLLFERFINPERISMPDFDIDFCQNGRQKVIDYVTEKYGEDKVSQIITFGTLKAKAVIRDVCRVFDVPYAEADMLAKLIPDELGITLEKAIELESKLQDIIESDPKIRQIFNIAKRLEGLYRHAGIHAAGVVITSEPLVNYCPLFRGKDAEQVCQFDKNFAELIGLVKFDFLGLKTLTVINSAEEFIRRDHDDLFDIETIDYENKEVYDFISKGETVGVFQLESSGMIDLCKRIKPSSIEDITAINALYRPGPMESGMLDDYIDIKNGLKKTTYPFPELEEVLKDTYGVIVYQEQVMKIAQVVAGYSLGQADMLRKAMGKKIVKKMEEHREIFLKGARERNFDENKAKDLYDLMSNFAAYGFNKSHAVAYSIISYQTAFLKYYYPPQFFAALLSTEINNSDKVTSYIKDAKRFDIEVFPPDINESLWLFNVVETNIRFGMGAIKNVGEGAVSAVICERNENGIYLGFIDFCVRVNLKAINKRTIESLIKVGAFDSCEKFNRNTLLENMEMVISYAQKVQEDKELGQANLFDLVDDAKDSGKIQLDLNQLEDFDVREKLQYESDLLGIYVSGHPLDRYSNIIEQLTSLQISEIQELNYIPKASSKGGMNFFGRDNSDNRDLTVAGMLSNIKIIITKKGDKMCFAEIEDLSGKIECVIFSKTFLEHESQLILDEPIAMEGYTKLSENPRKFFPTKIRSLKEEADDKVSGVRVNLDLEGLNNNRLKELKEVLIDFRGTVPLHIIFENVSGRARLTLGEEYLVNPTPKMAAKINEIFKSNSVQYIVGGQLKKANVDELGF